jgi:hypothetical protein
MTGSLHEVEDLVQETYLSASRAFDPLRGAARRRAGSIRSRRAPVRDAVACVGGQRRHSHRRSAKASAASGLSRRREYVGGRSVAPRGAVLCLNERSNVLAIAHVTACCG